MVARRDQHRIGGTAREKLPRGIAERHPEAFDLAGSAAGKDRQHAGIAPDAECLAREGEHCTIVSWGRAYHEAMKAADALAKDGIECDVIDPRTLRPLDHATILESVKKTNRLVVAHEHWPYGGPGAEIVDRVQREAFDHLDAPILRVTGRDVSMPYALNLEERVLVRAEDVAKAVKKVMYV